MSGEGGCGCPAAEEVFTAGFRMGAEFVLDVVAGRRGMVAEEVAWALRLSQAVGEPLSVELVVGAVARGVERAEERASLLLPSEVRSRWRSLRGNGSRDGKWKVGVAAGAEGAR